MITKQDYPDIKAAAQHLVGVNDLVERTRIPAAATIWPTEGGAFVEAQVWVSDEELAKYRQFQDDHKAALERLDAFQAAVVKAQQENAPVRDEDIPF